ncbi:MAG: transcription termination factor Rho [Lachnospiraceae bacterium]
MREKYESLSVATLRELAKTRGMKGISALKKADLIERMLQEDEKDAAEKHAQEAKQAAVQKPVHSDEAETKSEEKMDFRPRHTYTRRNEEESHRTWKNEDSGYRRTENTSYRRNNEGERTNYTRRNENIGYRRTDRGEMQGMNNYADDAYVARRSEGENTYRRSEPKVENDFENSELDSGIQANGILEVMPDGYGFIRCENYLPGENDVYVAPSQIRRFNLKTGDIVTGNTRVKTQQEKFSALLYISSINGYHPSEATRRKNFEDLTPIFPNERLRMETADNNMAMRIVDLVSPIGKGQRGMIVSPPKAGKTTLLKQMARSIVKNNPDMRVIILLIDERPEEVTDIKEAIEGENVEVIYSTFDELPEHHKRVSEMVIERAKRLVEHKQDVTILLDSITRLARAYNLTVPPSGRTLSGGLDPAALHMPKRFFGAARKMREGGSLTILATALVDTGSKMDDVVYEEFKGTGNMELVLDRKLSEKRVFPAIDITRSGTRREDLLLDAQEQEAVTHMRRAINGMRTEEAVENILNMFAHTKNNREFIETVKKTKL